MTLNERFDDIAEEVPAIIWLTDAAGEVIYVNRRWTEFTGRTRESDLGRAWREALHPDDERRTTPIIRNAVAEQRSYSVEYRMRRADGAYRWMLDRGTPRPEAEGDPGGYIGTVIDISERKLSEEALRWSESRFRSLAESVPHIMWGVLPQGSLHFLNDRVTTITGLPPVNGRLAVWLRVIHPEDVAETLVAWRESLRSESVFEVEHRVQHHTGTYCWYLTRAVPHRDDDGTIKLWYGTSTDIHQQKEVESALRDNRERLDASLEASQTGTFRWDIARDTVEWDDNLYRLFGRTPDGSIRDTASVIALIHPDDQEMVATGTARIKSEGLDYIHEFRVVCPDGNTRWISHRAAIHRDEHGTPAYLIGACTDITSRKAAEISLQDAKNESERANAAKDQFLAILSHELRTPLNPVKMVLDMLATDEQLGDDTRTLLDTARRNVDVQARLIDDLLDLTRIASGKLRIERNELRLHEVIQNVIDICSGDVQNQDLTVEFCPNAASDRLMADPARVRQVFWNLLRNAAKFTPRGGSITIKTFGANGRVRVEVTDTGIGIDPERVQQIFEPFEQERTERREGLGLGLAISRSIVELHGGRIEAKSDGVGTGTTFNVEFPLLGMPELPTVMGSDPDVRVLLVETDLKLRQAIAMWLEARGFVVMQAWSGEEALRIADTFEPHVLVSDLRLPTMNGAELMTRMKKRQPVFGIAISGSGNSADVANTLNAGYSSYLVKPLDLDRLLGEIIDFAGKVPE